MTTAKVYSVFRRPGTSCAAAATYGGHTIACAATLANIDIIERKGLVENARVMGEYLRGKLEGLKAAHTVAGRVSGIGLLQALFLEADPKLKLGTFMRDYCYRNGMIMRNNGDILVFAPALIITRQQVDDIMRILDAGLCEAERSFGL